jgi:hypothetical protein
MMVSKMKEPHKDENHMDPFDFFDIYNPNAGFDAEGDIAKQLHISVSTHSVPATPENRSLEQDSIEIKD